MLLPDPVNGFSCYDMGVHLKLLDVATGPSKWGLVLEMGVHLKLLYVATRPSKWGLMLRRGYSLETTRCCYQAQ